MNKSLKGIGGWQKYSHLLLIAILALGYLLRLQGIDFGLPFVYDEDESRRVDQAMQMLVNRDPNPHWFGHPASTIIYLLAGNYLIAFSLGKILGIYDNFAAFESVYFHQPDLFYLLGRYWLAAVGTGTILLTYYVGGKLRSPRVGLIAAFLIAITPLHIKYSKIIRSDVLLTFFLLLAFWYCLAIVTKPSNKNYFRSGFCLGLAVVTKYPAIILMPTITLTHFLTQKSPWVRQKLLWISAGGCLLASFLAAPFLFLDIGTAIQDISHEARGGNVGGNGEGWVSNLVWYCQEPLTYCLSHYGMVLLLIGLLICLFTREKKLIILASFPLLFWLFIASLSLRWDRWVIPLLPFTSLLIALALDYIVQKIQGLMPLGWIFSLIILGLIAVPLMNANQAEIWELSGFDTRTVTREWMLANLPPGTSILVDEGTPPLPLDFFQLYEVRDNVLGRIEPEASRHAFIGVEIKEVGKLKDITTVQAENIQYLVLSWKYLKYLEERDRYPEIVANYKQIIASGSLAYQVERDKSQNITSGPEIQIYRLPSAI